MCLTGCSKSDGPSGGSSPASSCTGTTAACSGSGTGWTPADIKSALDSCDGGAGTWAAAKAANGGTDPTLVKGNSVIGTGGSVNTGTGVITLDDKYDKCNTIETLIQETSNMSHKADFDKVDADAAAGKLSRDEYIRAKEKIEYQGVQKALQAEKACTAKWGCSKNSFSYASVTDSQATNFDDYFNHWLGSDHKDYWGNAWDSRYRDAYSAAHP